MNKKGTAVFPAEHAALCQCKYPNVVNSSYKISKLHCLPVWGFENVAFKINSTSIPPGGELNQVCLNMPFP
jgi:hypothetical protein